MLVSELMDVGCGFLNDSARNAVIELQMNDCVTYFQRSVDISPAARTRKNASGVYFDTPAFQAIPPPQFTCLQYRLLSLT